MAYKPFKKPLAILMIILLAILIIFLAVLTWNAVKQHDYIGRSEQQLYTITMSGEGKVTAVPNIAEVTLGVQTEGSSVVKIQKENSDKVNSLIKQLKDFGIASDDIKTTNYSIYPLYDWLDNRQQLRGYQISNTVTVKIRDLEKIGNILEEATKIGINQVGGLNFTIDDLEKIKQEAREKALENAKSKIEALSKIAGVKLGRLVSFSENAGGYYPIYDTRSLGMEKAVSAGAVAPQVEPGSQEIIVNVTVTYEVL